MCKNSNNLEKSVIDSVISHFIYMISKVFKINEIWRNSCFSHPFNHWISFKHVELKKKEGRKVTAGNLIERELNHKRASGILFAR
jgi:hypothetical protein